MPTIAEIIDAYPIAQYLAANDIPTRGLNGGGVNIALPQKIRNIGKTVKRIYDSNPNDSTLPITSNFLWTLMGVYGQRALSQQQATGSIAAIAPTPGLPQPIDWIISATASATAVLSTGQSSVLLNGASNMPDLRGYNVEYVRGGITQYTTDPGDGSTYYSWNRTTGLFSISTAANVGEQMRITPIS